VNRKVVCGSLCLGLALAPGVGSQQARPSEADLARITERGRTLAEYDRAAWHAADAVQMANPKTTEGQRSVAAKEGGRWRVVFGSLDAAGTRFLVRYEAVARGSREEFIATRVEPPRNEAGFYLVAGRALEICLGDFGVPKRAYNSAVLPTSEGRWYVYLYPAQTKAGIYPLGGDARYLVSADGRQILEKRVLHLAVSEPASAAREKGAHHTHPLSDLPEDTDVLRALEQGAPETVTTPHFVYEVSADGTIEIRKEKKR
jgi:hypothetical protein